MAKYLTGENPINEVVVEVIEVIPEKEVKTSNKTKTTTKKKKSNKK